MKEIERPSITEVYEHYGLRIIGHGAWAKAQCPLSSHEDANPSASVNEELGKFNCFSCGNSGDSLDVIMEREGFARITDAQRWAAEKLTGSSRVVRAERGPGSELLGRTRTNAGAGNWQPPWGRV